MTLPPPPGLEEGVPLSRHTTLGVGGPARYFLRVGSHEELRTAIVFAHEHHLPILVLGGGSNIVVRDHGFDGIAIQIGIRGVQHSHAGDSVVLTAAAGEPWDDLVSICIERGWSGVECLSGIPGLVGATPIQNVGAYGQEVSDTIRSVEVFDRETLAPSEIPGPECGFGYRTSRFKTDDAGRFVVTAVTFSLTPSGRPSIRYAELERSLKTQAGFDSLPAGAPSLRAVRDTVLSLRRSKSMVLDPGDSNACSAGSFFLNPVLTESEFRGLRHRWQALGGEGEIPGFPSAGTWKVPAAWLVERAGFEKGFRMGRAGVSTKHALALVNHGGTAADLLLLAETIVRRVYEVFGVSLEKEPVILQ